MADALSIPTIARLPMGVMSGGGVASGGGVRSEFRDKVGGGASRSALATGQYGPGEQPLRFANTLERIEKTPEEKATEAAKEFVAIALVQPTLKALRESNHAAPPFAPGDAERRFGALLDAEWAKRITESSNFPLVDAVRERMLGVPSTATPRSPGPRPTFEAWPEGVPVPTAKAREAAARDAMAREAGARSTEDAR